MKQEAKHAIESVLIVGIVTAFLAAVLLYAVARAPCPDPAFPAPSTSAAETPEVNWQVCFTANDGGSHCMTPTVIGEP